MQFKLKAVDSENRVIALQLEAGSEAGARELAHRRGYSVLSVGQRTALGGLSRKRRFQTTLFSIELLALLDAGLNVVEALQTLAEKQPNGGDRDLLVQILGALNRGESLSQAVAHFPDAFPSLYAATIRSSEQTGDLKEALARHVRYQEELDAVRKKVLSTLLYPVILMTVGTLVLAFLMFYVVPRFARVYDEISADLPFFSSLLFATGAWIERNGPAALLVASALVVLAVYGVARHAVRARFVARLWRLPAVGERMRVYQLARFYRTVAMLLRAGIPALKAFEMVARLLPLQLRPQLERAMSRLREGQPISAALTHSGLTTPVATRMMLVGERSGRMGELMDRIARFYDDETARFIDAFARTFEPVLMLALGLAVGLVVVLMYMPIFELAASIK